MEGSTSEVFLTRGREVHLAGFSKHSCVSHWLCLLVHHCTAVWLMVKGRRRRSKRRKGRRWRSSRASPAGPGTCPGRLLQLLLWRKSQLSLTTSRLPQVSSPLSCLYPQTLFNSIFFCLWVLFLFFSGLFSICKNLQATSLSSSYYRASPFASSVLCPWSPVSSPHQMASQSG